MAKFILVCDGTFYHGTPFVFNSSSFASVSLEFLEDTPACLNFVDKTFCSPTICYSKEKPFFIRSLTFLIPSAVKFTNFHFVNFGFCSQHAHPSIVNSFSAQSHEIEYFESHLLCTFDEYVKSEMPNFYSSKSLCSPLGILLHLDARLASALVFELSCSRIFRRRFNKWLSSNADRINTHNLIDQPVKLRNRLGVIYFILHEPPRQPINYCWYPSFSYSHTFIV